MASHFGGATFCCPCCCRQQHHHHHHHCLPLLPHPALGDAPEPGSTSLPGCLSLPIFSAAIPLAARLGINPAARYRVLCPTRGPTRIRIDFPCQGSFSGIKVAAGESGSDMDSYTYSSVCSPRIHQQLSNCSGHSWLYVLAAPMLPELFLWSILFLNSYWES